jgi:hypothetical protein
MSRLLVPLRITQGLIAAIVGALCGFLFTYALVLAPHGPWWFWESDGWSIASDIDRGFSRALFVGVCAGWAAFATFAPPGKHRLIMAVGAVFLLSPPMTLIGMFVFGEQRMKTESYSPPRPLELAALVLPATLVGVGLAAYRSRPAMERGAEGREPE